MSNLGTVIDQDILARMIERYDVPNNYEEPPTMNFQVGDVVRPKYEHGEIGRQGCKVTAAGPSSVHYLLPDGTRTAWDRPEFLELVSRPSDSAKPALKVGDRVRILMSAGKDNGKIDFVSRVTPYQGRDHYELKIRGLFEAEELEFLPPEPAKPSEAQVAAWMDAQMKSSTRVPKPWEKEEIPGKPMTATQASILYENGKHGAAEMTLEQVENLRRHIYATNPAIKNWLDGLPTDLNPLPTPNDGWMPAGTYLPLKEQATPKPSRPRKPCWPHDAIRRAEFEHGPGISQTIPAYERRFPSRTLSWAPYDIIDSLEDA